MWIFWAIRPSYTQPEGLSSQRGIIVYYKGERESRTIVKRLVETERITKDNT